MSDRTAEPVDRFAASRAAIAKRVADHLDARKSHKAGCICVLCEAYGCRESHPCIDCRRVLAATLVPSLDALAAKYPIVAEGRKVALDVAEFLDRIAVQCDADGYEVTGSACRIRAGALRKVVA